MNGNSPQKTPAISDWLKKAALRLVGAGIGSAKLDAEIILAHTLKKSRTYLHAYGEESLGLREQEIADARLELRLDRTPIAYIIGHKEFYGRLFRTTPATLIPRPESETMIDILKELVPKNQELLPRSQRLVDVGTGTGCLGITAKLEAPELEVTLIDISRHALKIAAQNAEKLHADVDFLQSNLLELYPFKTAYILANLPYVDLEWERSPETDYEPELALFAGEHGLHLIRLLITEATSRLVSNGYLFLEADPRQHDTIKNIAKTNGFHLHETRGFVVVLQKD